MPSLLYCFSHLIGYSHFGFSFDIARIGNACRLEWDGLITTKVYPQVPPKVEYSLTEKGDSLMPILYQLCD
jgi:hypothetical protein